MRITVGMAISLVVMLTLIQGAVFAATTSKVKVFIENGDDDNAWPKIYLNGGYMGGTVVPGGTTKYFSFYRLSEGPHEFKIEWKDPDTCERAEKTVAIESTGEDLEVTLKIDPSESGATCKKNKVTYKRRPYATLDVWVKNLDDDNTFVILTVDGKRRTSRPIAKYSESRFMRIFNMATGTHEVTMKWKESDTKKWHEKTQEVTLVEGKNKVVMETEEVIYTHEFTKPNSSIEVYVKNVDDDELWVDVLVDSTYRLKKVRAGALKHYGKTDKLYPGRHTVRLRWIDPDVKGWQEKGFVVYLDKDEAATRIAYTVRNTR